MNKRIEREYRTLRHNGHRAIDAIRAARINFQFETLENKGLVRLDVIPDEVITLEDLEGDAFNPKANPDIDPRRLAKAREEFQEKVNRDGVWVIVGAFECPACGNWETADSVQGFVGEDWKDSGYDVDVKLQTMKALKEAQKNHGRKH